MIRDLLHHWVKEDPTKLALLPLAVIWLTSCIAAIVVPLMGY